jgi:hypothetical protein
MLMSTPTGWRKGRFHGSFRWPAEAAMGSENIPYATRDEAIERLAGILHDRMEHLDPTTDAAPWEGLTEQQKEFYRACVDELACYTKLMLRALCEE